ncbi:MAG: glycosyltransferase [Candidatus Heimdallarchaeota archaeon]|nr:glycosyltransferase [Candidatus Heimdallarchaeota archaeon]
MDTQTSQNNCQIAFEISNEIGNKIGGIYSVIASKAPEMQRLLGPGNYIAIGLYNAFKARNDFEEMDIPLDLVDARNMLRIQGIDIKYGHWVGGGFVETILVDPSYLLDVPLITGKEKRKIDEIKGILWDWFNIDSLWMPEVFDPMVAFGWAAGVVVAYLAETPRFKGKNIVAHFHEWISGPGLLYLKKNNIPVATVFMTHATQLGRNIAMGPEDINEILDDLFERDETIPPQKAYQYHVEGTHQIEVICSKEADVLITVSEAVARETEGILGQKADFIIPNGINFDTLSKKEDLVIKHKNARLGLTRFVEAYFNPYYSINFENLLIIHISGRYEYHNKGIDVFLEALKIVNENLKANPPYREILAFIWVPAPVSGIKPNILEAFKNAKNLREAIQDPLIRIEEWLSLRTSDYKKHLKSKSFTEFFSNDEINMIDSIVKRGSFNIETFAKPPICPFNLNERDTIYQELLKLNLTNDSSDNVKVVFYPIYLSRDDPLLGLNYFDAVCGSDMGIYPSTYEPYGLTPLEALALGVPAVTTDLSGFGLLVNELTKDEVNGIYVLKRKGRTNNEAAQDLAEIIINQSKLTKEKVVQAREKAREISEMYTWKNIIKEYKRAYDQAMEELNRK